MRLHTIADEDVPVSEQPSRRSPWVPMALFVLLLAVPIAVMAVTPLPGGMPAPTAEQAGEQQARPSLFWFVSRSLGVVFGPLLLLCFINLAALIVLQSMDLRVTLAIPAAFVERFTDLVNQRRFREAFEVARKNPSFLARVLTAGMGRLQYGLEDARVSAAAMSKAVHASKSQLNDYQKMMAIISPMLGLLATLCGVVAVLQNAPQSALLLSAAIGQCLVSIAVSMIISLGATFSYLVCKNRLTRISMDVDSIADDLLTQMYHNAKGKGLASGWN
jgi:biopolymer transport protein ExbB